MESKQEFISAQDLLSVTRQAAAKVNAQLNLQLQESTYARMILELRLKYNLKPEDSINQDSGAIQRKLNPEKLAIEEKELLAKT